jgi:NAD(P)-dependent dehydrogenase (short-subunit alcohol dehydrogenase family)
MSERKVIITGANSGIGKAAAFQFAAAGHHVTMACRDPERSRLALEEVRAASPTGAVELMRLDVSSFAAVREFAVEFTNRHQRLDTLIHNAGSFDHGLKSYQFSADGLEKTFATNVFGPFLLTELLLEPLARSADPRVLFAASTNLKNFFDPKRQIEFDNLRGECAGTRPYSSYKMYGDSKMAVLLLTYRMAEEYAPRGIKVYSVMIPATKIRKEALNRFRGKYRLIGPLIQNLNPWAIEPKEMGEVYYQICTSPRFAEVTGSLVDSKLQVLPPVEAGRRLNPLEVARELRNTRHAPPYAGDPENVERMWRVGREVIEGVLDGMAV